MDEKTSTSPAKKRGRPPKQKTEEVVNETNQAAVSDPNQSYEYNALSNAYSYSSYFLGVNIFDYYSEEDLKHLVDDPITHNEMLRKLSLMLYGQNGVYTNTTDYMVAMPCLYKVIVTHGKNKTKKIRNKELMSSTLRRIKDKEVVRDALFKGIVEGIYFGYFEATQMPNTNKRMMSDYDVASISEINELGINASVISLPTDYTRIVGVKNASYVIAFNLQYFDEASGEATERKLRKFPKEIRDAYSKWRDGGKTNGNWVVLNNDNTIVHKIRSKKEEIWGRPMVLAAINDILYADYFITTKRNVLDEMNNRIIYQTFPEGKDKGTSALTKQQQQHQHDAVKSAVLNKNTRGGTSFFSVAANTKIQQIETSSVDIFDEKYEGDLDDRIAMSLGLASSLLSGSGSGSYSAQENNLELVSAQLFQWIEQIESELNKCIAANIIKDKSNWVECRYLPITHANKKAMVGHTRELYLEGSGSISLWAAACGIDPDVFFAMLDEEIETGVYDKYKPHQTAYTNTSDNTGGRPTNEDSTNPNTLQTRANNTNNTPKPSTA